MENIDEWCFCWFEESDFEGKARAALLLRAQWSVQVISISFLEGDKPLQNRVQKAAEQWIAPGRANLRFNFCQDAANADIRISFSRPGSWSTVGTTCKNITDITKPTMNFGSLNSASTDQQLERVVLHEFGHALGLIHEHQHPNSSIKWNKPAVYADLTPYWSTKKIEKNVFSSEDKTIATDDFDAESIMLYPIPKKWTLDGFSTCLNSKLSTKDILFIRNVYG